MTKFDEILDWGPISRVRRNHGLEHATLNLLSAGMSHQPFSGHSDERGFWIVGNVSTEKLLETVNAALARMQAGERGLAISPNCGTNYVTAGVVAGTFAWLANLGKTNNFKKKFDRWPLTIMVATAALILSHSLGPKVQARVSTSGMPSNMVVRQIVQYERNGIVLHRITTEDRKD